MKGKKFLNLIEIDLFDVRWKTDREEADEDSSQWRRSAPPSTAFGRPRSRCESFIQFLVAGGGGQSGAALSPGTTSWRTWRQSGLESSRGGATPQRPLSDSQTVCTDKQTPQTDRRTPRHTLRVMPDSPVAPGGMNMTETRATAAIMTILTDPSQ